MQNAVSDAGGDLKPFTSSQPPSRPPCRPRTPRPRVGQTWYARCSKVCVLIVVFFVMNWWSSPVPHEGPFTRDQRAGSGDVRPVSPSAAPSVASDMPAARPSPFVSDTHKAALGSGDDPHVEVVLTALAHYKPFALFPKLKDVLMERGKWEETRTAWKSRQRLITQRALEDPFDAHTDVDLLNVSESLMNATTEPTTEEEEARESTLFLTDLQPIEDAVTFLRVRMTKLHSLFTLVTEEDTLNSEKRLALWYRFAANRRAALHVGGCLCGPLNAVLSLGASHLSAGSLDGATRAYLVSTLQELILREASLNTSDIERHLGFPDTVRQLQPRQTKEEDDGEGGVAEGEQRLTATTTLDLKMTDHAQLAARVRELQRRVIYTCHILRTREKAGSPILKGLVEELKRKAHEKR